ncbi:hypothetical protein NA619_21620 [Pseudomonas stutzeri]|nr:hypothetical protein [Stutzerimonas stutzeri]MCQ4260595.1 hypothetical protein [Stutzerimonas stutzeri]
MSTVEQRATDLGIMTLLFPYSVTAERFYQKLGYSAVHETYHGEERTIVMERCLIDPDSVWAMRQTYALV